MGNLQAAQNTIDESGSITTWNGAKSYSTVNDPLVEIFFKSVRNISCTDYRCIKVKNSKSAPKNTPTTPKTIEEYFDVAWASDPLRTLKFVFYLRDCRGGKGERKLFRALVRHMRVTKLSKHLTANIEHIPTFGSWKDISICFFGTELEGLAVKLIADQLKKDIVSENPSLCAKYAPSEGGAIDKAHKAASKIAAALGVTITRYRKKYLVPLRAKLNIIERTMCSKQWNDINYEKVPSIAGLRYKKAFTNHDSERYLAYLQSVQKGEKKMNTGVLMPHQIISPYLSNRRSLDETIEAQWTSFVADRQMKWPESVNIMPLVDVSGSMTSSSSDTRPLDVAISLGMLFSQLNTSERYRNKFITFSESPELLNIKGKTLFDKVKMMSESKWCMSTNFQKAFDLLLNIATTFAIPQEEMPQILLVLSDMQFNQTHSGKTNWDEINDKYEAAGYKRPTIIFWNLNGASVDYPVPDSKVKDCALLSGYNDSILYSLLDGEMPNPLDIVHKALDNERYNVITLA